MQGEFYFMAVGGMGVTLAGFAGLIAALQGPEGPVAAWRIRNVVYLGFGVTVVGFATAALYTITQDVTLTVRLATIVMVLTQIVRWQEYRPGPAWRDERQRRGAIFGELALVIAILVNIALASVGFLQLLLLAMLIEPVGIFANSVREVTQDTDASSGADGSAPPQT